MDTGLHNASMMLAESRKAQACLSQQEQELLPKGMWLCACGCTYQHVQPKRPPRGKALLAHKQCGDMQRCFEFTTAFALENIVIQSTCRHSQVPLQSDASAWFPTALSSKRERPWLSAGKLSQFCTWTIALPLQHPCKLLQGPAELHGCMLCGTKPEQDCMSGSH